MKDLHKITLLRETLACVVRTHGKAKGDHNDAAREASLEAARETLDKTRWSAPTPTRDKILAILDDGSAHPMKELVDKMIWTVGDRSMATAKGRENLDSEQLKRNKLGTVLSELEDEGLVHWVIGAGWIMLPTKETA